MSPIVQALFSPWEWRLEILIVLGVFATLYTVGWRRLRSVGHGRGIATLPRLFSYWLGLVVLATSLMSPIDTLGGQLFFMHMIQHLLSMMIAVPLLLLANPFPFILWGLPTRARHVVGRQFTRDAAVRTTLRTLTRPAVAWMAFLTIYLGWHEPALYNLALRRDWVHDVQHVTFFLAAMLFWWHVIGAAPRIHGRFPVWARMGYLIGAIPPNMMISVAIAFSSTVIYTYYESVPRIWGVTTLQDQMIAGVIMWIPGSMMFLLAALIVLARFGVTEKPNRRAARSVPTPASEAGDGADNGAENEGQAQWNSSAAVQRELPDPS